MLEGKESTEQEVKTPPTGTPKAPKSQKEQRIDELNKGIEEEKKKRTGIIDSIRRTRYKMAYKQAEFAALSKLNTLNVEKGKSIGYLKRMKERLEFKISTEASSLSAEKDLIRKINEINEELEKSIKIYRQRKKVELIKGDIEDATKALEELEKQILESNKALDNLYNELRSLTGYRGERQERKPGERRVSRPQKPQEISLADIAIIKDKKNGNNSSEEDIEISSN
ncbi:MAG: hypothetical protein KGH61_05235 [Candidatus Micrarchaeota archaeon]|nr:hypothetical protein [Candidatus Micrarchaeota archaeon]MDE1848318.1 hypothetical protein [Candidatus Micrarchaeota archaeon]MDE1864544.1 hypothetical protein [Candidatus Micrarchaeota archaeon]